MVQNREAMSSTLQPHSSSPQVPDLSRTFCRILMLLALLIGSTSASDDRTLASYVQSFEVGDARVFNRSESVTFESVMASFAINITEVDEAACNLITQQLTVNPGPDTGNMFTNLVEYSILWSSSEEDIESKFQNSLNANLTTLTTALQIGGLNITKSSEASLLLQTGAPTTTPASPEQSLVPSSSTGPSSAMPTTPPTSLFPSSSDGDIVTRIFLQNFAVRDGQVFDEQQINYFESILESYTDNIAAGIIVTTCIVRLQRVIQSFQGMEELNQVEYTMEWTTSDEDIGEKFINFLNQNLNGLTIDLRAGGLTVTESFPALAVLGTGPPSASPVFVPTSDSPSTLMPFGMPEIVTTAFMQQFAISDGRVFDDQEVDSFESIMESYTGNITAVMVVTTCTLRQQRLIQSLRRRLQGMEDLNQVLFTMEWATSDEDIGEKFVNFLNQNLDGLTTDLQAGGLNVSESSPALTVLLTEPPSTSPVFVPTSDSPSTFLMPSANPSVAPTASESPSTTPMVPSHLPSLVPSTATTTDMMPSSSHSIGVVTSLLTAGLLGTFTLMM